MEDRMSMTAPAVGFSQRISFEDFLATVDEGTHAEWVDGEIVRMSPASEDHAEISAFLLTIMRMFLNRTKTGGRVLHAPFQMKLARSGREPDVLFVSRENLHRFRKTYLDGPADLAVEIVSPDSRSRDRTEKFREYQEAGVREYWLIDPMQKKAEVYRLSEGGVYELIPPGEPARLRSEVIPEFWIDPAWLWEESPDESQALEEWGLA
jgi:Uma2 family endonuclease